MKKFFAVAAIACGLLLSAWAKPAVAQRGGYRGGGGYAGSGIRGEVNNGGGSRYYGYQPYHRGSFWPAYYGRYVYPYNAIGSSYGMLDEELYGSNWDFAYPFHVPRGSNPTVPPGPPYGAQAYAALAASNPSGAMSQPPPPRASESSTEATIQVSVPDPGARVSFDDTLTRQTGMERVFTSPALEPGKTYTYTVRVTWMEDDQEVTRTQDVRVQAGRMTAVDFRALADTGER